MVVEPQSLESLSAEQLRSAVLSMLQAAAAKDQELAFKQTLIDKLTHEMAVLKRLKFAATSERFASTLAPEQRSLLEETLGLKFRLVTGYPGGAEQDLALERGEVHCRAITIARAKVTLSIY